MTSTRYKYKLKIKDYEVGWTFSTQWVDEKCLLNSSQIMQGKIRHFGSYTINVVKPWCQYASLSKRTAWLYDWQQLA